MKTLKFIVGLAIFSAGTSVFAGLIPGKIEIKVHNYGTGKKVGIQVPQYDNLGHFTGFKQYEVQPNATTTVPLQLIRGWVERIHLDVEPKIPGDSVNAELYLTDENILKIKIPSLELSKGVAWQAIIDKDEMKLDLSKPVDIEADLILNDEDLKSSTFRLATRKR